jgi:hypothetical protein
MASGMPRIAARAGGVGDVEADEVRVGGVAIA